MAACTILWLGTGAALAQGSIDLSAHYTVSMTYVRVGELTWAVHLSAERYLTSANGKASGMFSVLFDGEGAISTRGTRADGRLVPADVTASISDDEERYTLDMVFENGAVGSVDDHGAKPSPDRKPVTPDMLDGVADPLTAMLIPAPDGPLVRGNCGRTLKIFDGRRRYDLALSFKRIDTIKVARGYDGKVLVCGVVLKPIAGHRPDSRLVRYLAGKTDLELWFAPIAGADTIAPVRALMPTLVGTLELAANEFRVTRRGASQP